MSKKRVTRAAQHRAVVRRHRHLYDDLLAFQNNGCAICGKPPNPERRHHIDHDHRTMLCRGILCAVCNRRLSNRITAEWLTAAAAYLTDPPFERFMAQ